MNRPCLLAAVLTASFAVTLEAADWPQWRGPNRDGISQETGLLTEWPKAGPKLLWEIDDAGSGYSTPSVVGGRIFLMGNEGLENEFVRAFDVRDGSQVWSATVGKVGNPNQKPPYPGSRSTPTVDGDAIYALGSDGDLACLDAATGDVRWTKNVRTEFGGKPGEWAYAESPLVDGDKVIVTPGGAEATLAAIDKKTGETVWKSAVPGGDEAAYSSAIVVDAGVKQYVQFLAKGLVGVDAETGEFLWKYEKTAQGSPANMATPVARDGLVYSASRRAGGGLVRLKVDGGKIQAEEVYASPRLPKAIGGSVLVGPHLYGTTNDGLLCVDFESGEVKWQERAVGAAAILFADDRLYLHGEEGEVALVEASPEGYREKGRFTPANAPEKGESKAWAYPVVANGRLYIRDMGKLWCYDVRGRESASLGVSR